ncbi:MAG: tetratricopeptide repeat protein, partial [bacterium]
ELNAAWRRDIEATKEYYWRKNFNAGFAKGRIQALAESSNHFKAATIIYPERAISHRLYGEASLALGDTTQALSSFEQTLSLDPEDHRSRRNTMSIYFSLGEYEQAIRLAEVLLQSFEDDVEALRIHAYSLDRIDNRQAATEAYTRLIDSSTDHEDVEYFAAFKYRTGLYEDAIVLSQLAVERGGNREENWQAIVQSRLMQQNYPELLSAASTLLIFAPDNLVALELKRFAQITLGQFRQAEQTKLDYLHAMARIRLKQRNYPELLETTDEILSIQANDLEALRLRAATFDSIGEYRNAREARLLYLDLLAKKYREEGHFLEAIRTTAQTLALDSTNYEAAQLKQQAHDSLGQKRLAIQTQITYLAAVARTHLRNRNFYAFMRKSMEILSIDGKNLMALRYRQMAHDSLGQFREAELAEIDYLLALSRQELANKNYEAVIVSTDKILDIDRLRREAVKLKVAAHESMGQIEQANRAKIAYQLVSIESTLEESNGTSPHSNTSRYQKILAAVDTILAIEPYNIPALEHRKNAYEFLGQSADAQNAEIDYLLAISRKNIVENEFQELLETSEEILAIDSMHLYALGLKRDALSRLGRANEAKKAEVNYLLAIADSLAVQNNFKELIRKTEQILALDKLNKPAVDFKQSAHRALGQRQLENETIINYWFDLAALRMKQKKYHEVHALADSILNIDPLRIDALTLKRNAFLSTASLDEAMAIKKQIESLTAEKN